VLPPGQPGPGRIPQAPAARPAPAAPQPPGAPQVVQWGHDQHGGPRQDRNPQGAPPPSGWNRPHDGGAPPSGWRYHDHEGGQPGPGDRGPETRGPENRFPDNRPPDNRPPDNRPHDQGRPPGPRPYGDHGPDGRDRGDERGPGDYRGPGRDHDRGGGPRWAPHVYPPTYRSPYRYHGPAWRPPHGYYYRPWRFGEILPYGWYAPDYQLVDWWDYDLPEPPPGYVWVRVGADALLVEGYSGRIVQVVRYLFW
jgi:Ni/Co efflux regulator RcnB